MNKTHLITIQLIFIVGIVFGNDIAVYDRNKWFNVARYILYLVTIQLIPELCRLAHQHYIKPPIDLLSFIESVKQSAILLITSASILLYFEQNLFKEDFAYVFFAYLLTNTLKMEPKPSISYGVGMACSFFEGYLIHVIPSDGDRLVGFEENIRALEDNTGVYFPVKKLFIIITNSLFCPPSLEHFNRSRDIPYLEPFKSLEDVVRNVAGVRGRQYRNTAYRIYRPAARAAPRPALPVSLAAECATPLHTLYKVVNNRMLYQEVADIDVNVVKEDFCRTLKTILDKSPQCRGKCELVFFDDLDPTQNLAQILLDRIKELEPNFEEKLISRMEDNVIGD